MGDPKRQRKKYVTPKYPWSRSELDAEIRLMGDYGLRNKHELWRHYTELSKYRALARKLLGKTAEERVEAEKQLISKLYSSGLVSENASLDDVLDLSIKDALERRLQSIVLRQGLAKSPQQARQLIVHGHLSIKGKRVKSPSRIVSRDEENALTYASTSRLSNQDHPLRKDLSPQTGS